MIYANKILYPNIGIGHPFGLLEPHLCEITAKWWLLVHIRRVTDRKCSRAADVLIGNIFRKRLAPRKSPRRNT